MSMKEWTIMIYMAGDNNLSVDMAYALEQIKGIAGPGPESPNLLVYYDGNSPSIPTMYCDFSVPGNPTYVRSVNVPDKLCWVPKKLNENAADKRAITNFVHWCVNQVEVVGPDGEITYGRRANRYAMIFSGHSLGFQDIGLFKDESTGKTMKMKDLYFTLQDLVSDEAFLRQTAIENGVPDDQMEQQTKVIIGQRLDLLGFDACVMGMLEVGYQFSYIAKTIIASEGSVPSAGWTYAKILGALTGGANRKDDAKAVAARFVRDFIRSQDAYTVGGVSVDMAAWDTEALNDVAILFDSLAITLLDCFRDPNERIYKQMQRVILQVHWQCQSYMYDQNVDLGDFCELLERECSSLISELGGGDDTKILEEICDWCRKVLDAIRKAVILSGFSGGEYQYSNGMSVFFPWSREGYEVSKENYEGLFYGKDVGRAKQFSWIGFLRKYLGEVALRKFEPLHLGTKYRYESGIKFFEDLIAEEDFQAPAFDEDDRIAGQRDSKLAGQRDSKLAGQRDSKLAGQRDSKLAGQRDSKLAGQRDSKLAGQRDSKLAGQRDSKLAGQRDSKLAGQRDSKLAGQRDSKLAGQRDSKMAGGSSASTAFFDNLKLFKNIEMPWNVSGFSRDPDSDAG